MFKQTQYTLSKLQSEVFSTTASVEFPVFSVVLVVTKAGKAASSCPQKTKKQLQA